MNKKYLTSLMTTLLLAGPLVHSTVVDASQNSEDSESHELESLEKEKIQLKEDITEAQVIIDDLVIDLSRQEEALETVKEEVEQSEKEVGQLNEQIELRSKELLSNELSEQTEDDRSDNMDTLTSTEDLSLPIGRMGDVNNLVSSNRDVLLEQIKDQKKLEKAEEQLKLEQQELENVEEQLEFSRTGIISQRADLDDQIIQIAEEFDMTEDEKESFINEQTIIAEQTSSLSEEMKAEKQRIIEEEREKEEAARLAEEERKKEAEEKAEAEAKEKEEKEKEEAEVSTSSPGEANESDSSGWTRPATGRLSSPYGYRTHPVTGEKRSFHAGIDIAGSGPVVASRGGTVTSASYSDTYGYTVIIDHGEGYSTLYAHLKADMSVSEGQRVSQGQQLGIMGTTGRSTGVHLHFEVRKDGTAVDPMNYIE